MHVIFFVPISDPSSLLQDRIPFHAVIAVIANTKQPVMARRRFVNVSKLCQKTAESVEL